VTGNNNQTESKMKTKHTPGPLALGRPSLHIYEPATGKHIATMHIADFCDRGPWEEEAEATGVLFSLAPEMAEALKRCEQIMSQTAPASDWTKDWENKFTDAIIQARSLLAKLEGGAE
jgi:hypothetical protein